MRDHGVATVIDDRGHQVARENGLRPLSGKSLIVLVWTTSPKLEVWCQHRGRRLDFIVSLVFPIVRLKSATASGRPRQKHLCCAGRNPCARR